MLVGDIKLDISRVTGWTDDPTIYNRLTDAIDLLANKGHWDSMLAYMDIVVGSGNVVTLPREVRFPIKININKTPSFMRSRLYEFQMDGPGNDMADTSSFSWLDKGQVPVLAQPATPSTLKITNPNTADNGKLITIYGRDANNLEIQDVLAFNSLANPVTVNTYKEVTRINKDVTVGKIMMYDSGNNLLANYYPDETEPWYAQIRLTVAAPAIRMLFRRRTHVITSDEDFIPLRSKPAVLMMLKAAEGYRNGTTESISKGQAFEKIALQFLKEEQDINSGADISQQTEVPPLLDINYNNVDSIIVADIYDDLCSILGPIGRRNVFDSLTETLEALHNKGNWDGLTGYVDIITDNHNYVTLPRYVEAPIALNINGMPKAMRSKWFEFHLNGSGSLNINSQMWDDVGDVVTIRPLTVTSQFIAQPDLATDDSKIVTIFGWDENSKWIRTQVAGVWQDGFQVVMDHTGATPATNAQKCSRIERIIKDETVGFVQLVSYDPVSLTTNQMGYYYPDETEPNYRRIKLPYQGAWVRMRYRKRALKITSLTDPIHLKNKMAVITMLRSLNEIMSPQPDFEKATNFENKAMQYLIEEQASRNPNETFEIQFSHTPCHAVIL